MNLSQIELPSNKKFGYFFSIIFSLLTIYFYYISLLLIFYFFLILAITFFFITAFKPILLHPLNKLWMKLGYVIGFVVSPIILGLIFFGIFTPASLLMSIFSRDELFLKLSKKSSYWKDVSTSIQKHANFKLQY